MLAVLVLAGAHRAARAGDGGAAVNAVAGSPTAAAPGFGGLPAADATAAATAPATVPVPSARALPAPERSSPYRAVTLNRHARARYAAASGIQDLSVRRTNANTLIRFSYRVVDPYRAAALNEKSSTAYMIAPRTGAVLQVPVMDKIGQLRQAQPPEAGKEYWMVFSNKGHPVKAGDRVDIVIGAFRADNLLVK